MWSVGFSCSGLPRQASNAKGFLGPPLFQNVASAALIGCPRYRRVVCLLRHACASALLGGGFGGGIPEASCRPLYDHRSLLPGPYSPSTLSIPKTQTGTGTLTDSNQPAFCFVQLPSLSSSLDAPGNSVHRPTGAPERCGIIPRRLPLTQTSQPRLQVTAGDAISRDVISPDLCNCYDLD